MGDKWHEAEAKLRKAEVKFLKGLSKKKDIPIYFRRKYDAKYSFMVFKAG